MCYELQIMEKIFYVAKYMFLREKIKQYFFGTKIGII